MSEYRHVVSQSESTKESNLYASILISILIGLRKYIYDLSTFCLVTRSGAIFLILQNNLT